MSDVHQPHHLPLPFDRVKLTGDDGHVFEVGCYDGNEDSDRPVLMICPAMGTKARNYRMFASELVSLGYRVAIIELRGHGTSSQRASHGCNYGYADMLKDWAVATRFLHDRYQTRDLILLGHSLGGQISCLYSAANPQDIAGLITIASCSVYYRCFGIGTIPFRIGLSLVTPIVKVLGYFPGDRLGFARREGARLMRDWAYQGRTGNYRPWGDPTDYEAAMRNLNKPVLCLEMAGDSLAPPAAVDHLMAKLPAATLSRQTVEVPGKRGKEAHFAWVKQPRDIARKIDTWLASWHRASEGNEHGNQPSKTSV